LFPLLPPKEDERRRIVFDTLYEPENVDPKFRPIFEQLRAEFPAFQVWQRHENFDRRLIAGVLNPSTQVAVTITLRADRTTRNSLLSATELKKIRDHLSSNAKEDLSL
jgi:hypothetical protein